MTTAPLPVLSHLTAPTLTIEAANGVTYRYRRFGDVDPGPRRGQQMQGWTFDIERIATSRTTASTTCSASSSR